MTTLQQTAWDLIGFDGSDGQVRIVGGRTLYEAVTFYDNGRATRVKLSRLDTANGLRQVDRYVDPDTLLEVVPDTVDGVLDMLDAVRS